MNTAKLTVTDLAAGLCWQSRSLPAAAADCIHQVSVYPQAKGQQIEGFGGAFTEAAAHCWQRLTPANRQRFLERCFGPDGLRYTLGRTHMGSCDFSLGLYSCRDADDGTFSLERDEKYLLPMIRAAQQTAGVPLGLLLSPWSPPAYMKSNRDRRNGGHLEPRCRAQWAGCIAEYVRRYRAAGLDVRRVTVQNEPAAVQTWDSCIFTAQEEGSFAAQYLRAALDAAGCGDVKILAWDHNKEALVYRAAGTLSVPGAGKAVDGFAVHWYTGDHFEALAAARQLWPDKELWFTEGCVEYSRFDGRGDVFKAEMYAHDMLGNLKAGARGILDWNLLLDADGGPNHAGNYCEAPLMLTGDGSDFVTLSEYWYIGQFSRHIRPGMRAAASSAWCAAVEQAAFADDDGTVAVVLLNCSADALPVSVTADGETAYNFTLAPHSIATLEF